MGGIVGRQPPRLVLQPDRISYYLLVPVNSVIALYFKAVDEAIVMLSQPRDIQICLFPFYRGCEYAVLFTDWT